MARMIPDVAESDIDNTGERLLYGALRHLSDDHIVIHSYPWLRPGRDHADAPLREGEADFIVLHPSRGMLVLEVKGGAPYLERGTWFRGRGSRRDSLKDPFQQARTNLYALLKEIESRAVGVRRDDMVYGYAVAFPEAVERGALPGNSDPSVLLNAVDLRDPEVAIAGAFSAWRRTPRELSHHQLQQVVDALLPRLRLLQLRGPQLRADSERLVQLTTNQQQILESLLDRRRLHVEGVAGSGKTMLALEGAVRSALAGRKTLLTCYNRSLSEWLNSQLEEDARLDGLGGRLQIANFHRLTSNLCRQARIPFAPGDDARFWRDDAPDLLISAAGLLRGEGWSGYDTLIVDEGQDFVLEWWYALTELLADEDEGTVHVFQDIHQRLWPDAEAPPFELGEPVRLVRNCRNTQRISEVSAALVGSPSAPFALAPRGDAPRLLRPPSAAAARGIVQQQVQWLKDQGLRGHQIALIGPRAMSGGTLAAVSEVAGLPLTTEPAEWRAGGGVLCTTARAFKGLEADAVVLYDLDGFSDWFTLADLYVACTRARHLLLAVAGGCEVRAALEDAIAQLKEDA